MNYEDRFKSVMLRIMDAIGTPVDGVQFIDMPRRCGKSIACAMLTHIGAYVITPTAPQEKIIEQHEGVPGMYGCVISKIMEKFTGSNQPRAFLFDEGYYRHTLHEDVKKLRAAYPHVPVIVVSTTPQLDAIMIALMEGKK